MHRVSDEIERAARRWQGTASSRVWRTDRWLASRVQATIDRAAVRLELWDGSTSYAGPTPPIGDIVVHDRRALVGLAVNPELCFGEGYVSGALTVRGGLRPVVLTLSKHAAKDVSWRERITSLLSRNTLRASRRNVHHHYDLGNEFYQLWLDREMLYTCAYYPVPDLSLDEAQRAKMDHVCRKLRLRRGETVVEAGCGWGALALHMARNYGVRVRAFNVSREQLAYGRERAAREGLQDRVEFVDDDYRNVSGQFDAFVSVGMLEHVGLRNYPALAAVIRRSLRPGGRGLLHFIGRDAPRPLNAWIRRRIFPGAYPPTLAEVTGRVLAPAGMSVLDVENLRLHYARTLAHWSEKFTAAGETIRRMYSAEFERAWDLYLAGSEAAFATGWMQLFQIVFAPRDSAPPSWTRADPYDPDGAAA
jgi:cyclopropane-fatty-acyl-phospholipid synthase